MSLPPRRTRTGQTSPMTRPALVPRAPPTTPARIPNLNKPRRNRQSTGQRTVPPSPCTLPGGDHSTSGRLPTPKNPYASLTPSTHTANIPPGASRLPRSTPGQLRPAQAQRMTEDICHTMVIAVPPGPARHTQTSGQSRPGQAGPPPRPLPSGPPAAAAPGPRRRPRGGRRRACLVPATGHRPPGRLRPCRLHPHPAIKPATPTAARSTPYLPGPAVSSTPPPASPT